MYILRRKIERTAGPQPVYKAAVDAVVRTWIPAAAALLACAVTPQRAKLDVRAYEWGQSVTFVPPLVDARIRTYLPASTTELASFRTADRPRLDVRRYEWINGWGLNVAAAAATTAQRWPAILQGADPHYVTRARRLLDLRTYEWEPDVAWMGTVQVAGPSAAQRWPALLQASGQNYRTPDKRAGVDIRLNDGSASSFGVPLDQSEAWQAAIDAERSVTTPARLELDVRSHDWAPQAGWLYTANQAPPATVAQTWPAILQGSGLSYRTGGRPVVDVRRWAPDLGWLFSAQPVAATTAQIWPAVWLGTGNQYQTPKRGVLDVRGYEWTPPAWVFSALPVPATVAQTWPGVLLSLGLNYRTTDRPRLDVRGQDWFPAFSWLEPLDLVDGVAQPPTEFFIVFAADRWFVVEAVVRI